jgi:AmmeMemoRadiSam system protein B
MPIPEYPRLRASVSGQVDPADADMMWLFDSSRLSRALLRMHRGAASLLQLFDGQNTIRDMQAALMRLSGGQLVPLMVLEELAHALDEALFLEGPRLEDKLAGFLRAPVREPACVGAYESDPAALRRQIDRLFEHEQGPGRPADSNGAHARDLRGLLIPHIDFDRGGPTFAWGFRELLERCDASIFVIIGTSHYSARRFTLTRKDFRTPLGVAQTDRNYVDRLAEYYGHHAFDDEIAHLPEHSIEFQVVFLQYCLEGKGPFKIVPIVVGSFQDAIEREIPPSEREDIYLMIQALRKAEAEAGEKVCYISSGDLAHIGPKFGDRWAVDQPLLDWSRRQDHELLRRAELADLDGFYRLILDERDQRRTCGFPPTYTLMAALRPDHGKLLHYDQYVEPSGFESVSFASLAFYKRETTGGSPC